MMHTFNLFYKFCAMQCKTGGTVFKMHVWVFCLISPWYLFWNTLPSSKFYTITVRWKQKFGDGASRVLEAHAFQDIPSTVQSSNNSWNISTV
jgi:hypothetical protein